MHQKRVRGDSGASFLGTSSLIDSSRLELFQNSILNLEIISRNRVHAKCIFTMYSNFF